MSGQLLSGAVFPISFFGLSEVKSSVVSFRWQYKSNPKYPSATMVRDEVIQMLKGICTATICPTISLWLTKNGASQAYCGLGRHGFAYDIFQFLFIWICSDFIEFYYHRTGHTTNHGWKNHKWHHYFYNPSPFAVVADEYVDQFFRSTPLILFPLIMPTNMDIMYFQFVVFFYGYGLYLHWGYELKVVDAHHPWINTAYQHYLHHAISIKNKPLHTGFFFKIWDQLFGSVHKGKCGCAKCCIEAGQRTREAFEAVEKPDYSVLLSPVMWFGGAKTMKMAD